MKYALPLLITLVFFGINTGNCQVEVQGAVYFIKGSYAIPEKYKPMLRRLAEKCVADTCRWMKIYGYCDNTGTEEFNDHLSKQREEAVFDFLRSKAKFDTTIVTRYILGSGGDLYDLHFPKAHLHQRCVDVRAWFYKAKK